MKTWKYLYCHNVTMSQNQSPESQSWVTVSRSWNHSHESQSWITVLWIMVLNHDHGHILISWSWITVTNHGNYGQSQITVMGHDCEIKLHRLWYRLRVCLVDIKILELEYDKMELEYDKLTMMTTRPWPQTVFVIKAMFICWKIML